MNTITTSGHFFRPRPLFLFPQIGVTYVFGRIGFHSLSIYSTHNPKNQADWNKGGGLSFSVIPNRNAAMIGWRFYKGKFQMQPYLNSGGVNLFKMFDPIDVDIDSPILWSIEKSGSNTVFEINGKMWVTDLVKWKDISFPRFPYFGGDDTPRCPVSIDWWASNVK